MKRFLKWLLLSLMGIMTLLTVLITWIYSTEDGLKWSWQQLQNLRPQALSIREISGSLNDKLLLHEVLWQQQELSIKIPEIELQCHWFDLISNQLNCDSIDIPTIIINNYQRDTDVTNEVEIPDLPQFVVPIDVDIQSIGIKQIVLNSFTSNHSLLAENTFTEIQFKQLKYQQSTFSFDDISFDSNQIKVQLNGNIRPDKNWGHQLNLTINAPDFEVRLSSDGNLNSLSHFKIKSFSPIQAESSGDWFWNKGPFIRNAIYEANAQHITIQQQGFELNDLAGKFELNWPKFNSQATVDGSWQQYKNIQIHADVHSQDISNWKNQSQLDLQLKGLLADKLIREMIQPLSSKNELTANQPAEKSWPVDVALSAKLEHGIVQLESHNMQLGKLFGSFNGSLNILQDSLNSLTMAADLRAASLDALVGFPVADFTMAVKYYHHQGEWILDTQGHVTNIQHPDFSMNYLNWKINLGKQWKGNIQAKKIKIGQAVFEQPILHLMGTAHKHHLSVKTVAETLSHDNQGNIPKPIIINFDGKLEPTTNPTQWIIENLDAIVPLPESELSLAADKIILGLQQQKVDHLCLRNIGKACVSATYADEQGSASFKFDNWSLISVIDIAKIFSPLTNFSLAGTINGTAELAGSVSQIEKMQVNLTVPELRLESLTGESVWQNLTIQSAKNEESYNISLNWFNSQLDIKSGSWLSTINIPKSELFIDLKSTENIDLLLLQKNIDWTLPFHADNENKIVYRIPSLQLHANLARNKLATELEILLPEKDHISASLSSTWPLTPDAEIAGSIDLLINHFEGLKHWQNNIDAIDMSLQEKAILSGSWQEPVIDGQGKLHIKQLTLDELGLDVKDSYLSLTNNKEKVTINGVLKNLAGEVNVSGVATLYPEITASVNLIGQNITLVNDRDNKVVISPNIAASYSANNLLVDGKIGFDQVKIKFSGLPKQAIKVSSDQNIIGQQEQDSTAFNYKIQLELAAGPDVRFEGFGLSSLITGNLNALVQSNKPPSLIGRLNLQDGKFEAYKQKLTIEEGQLLFLGSIENPGIQFKAVRTIDEIKVGLIGDGSLSSPRLTLYSTPSMAEENILALLLTGRSIDSLSHSDGSAIANAAINIGVEGANIIAQKIATTLGLKNISVTSKSQLDSTKVDIGAKINDRLNVIYETIVDSKNETLAVWVIEYIISPSISLETASGEEISTSINYKKQLNNSPFDTLQNKN